MMHFPHCFRFSPQFRKNFRTFLKFLTILPFLDFHPPKFLTTFFLFIDQKFRISPLFSLFQYIFPQYRENYSFPLLLQIPPGFRQIHLLFTYFTCTFAPTLTMMHLCITQCTYWTPLFVCMIKNFYKCASHALYLPSLCHNLSHLLGPLPPSSVTYFMDGPLLEFRVA